MNYILDTIWKEPMKKLYFEGPSFLFWANRPSEDICSDLTNVKSSHWVNHIETCNELKDLTFHSFYVGVNSFIYFSSLLFIFYASFIFICIRCCCLR